MASDPDGTDGDWVGVSIREGREWVLLDGHRFVVAGLVAVGVLAFVTAISVSRLAPLRSVQPFFYLFSGLLGGNITLVTVVVAINQLLLSRELNRPGDLRSQIEATVDYRQDVGDEVGRVPPVDPPGFLRVLAEDTGEQARAVGSLAERHADEAVAAEIGDVVARVTDHLDRVDALVEQSGTSTFDVLSATIKTSYAPAIYDLDRIRSQQADDLPPAVDEAIDGLVDRLEKIDVARQYFKTVFLQEELAALSRHLFYVGIPAVAALAGGLFLFTAPGGASIPRPQLALLLPAIVGLGFLPLAVLFAYILRIATVARRTAAVLPFTTPTQDQ